MKPEDEEVLKKTICYDHFFDNINEIKKQSENATLEKNKEKHFSFKSIFRR